VRRVLRPALGVCLCLGLVVGCGKSNRVAGPGAPSSAEWVQTSGPSGDGIFALTLAGSSLIAGGPGGIYRSTDGGEAWRLTSQAQARDFETVGLLTFAATPGGVFWSSDQGATWTQSGLFDVRSIEAVGTSLFATVLDQGVFRSDDLGHTWDRTGFVRPPGAGVVNLLAADATLYVTLSPNGIQKSTDLGQTWSSADAGLPATDALAMCVVGAKVLASFRNDGVYASLDGGVSWIPSGGGRTWYEEGWAFHDLGDRILLGTPSGLMESRDGGAHWVASPLNVEGSLLVTAFAQSGATLYAGSSNTGVYRRPLGASSWSNAGPRSAQISSLFATDRTVFAGTRGQGVRYTTDGGTYWWNGAGFGFFDAFAKWGDDVFAIGPWFGVFHSGDEGLSWDYHANAPAGESAYTGLAAGPRWLVAAVEHDGGIFRSNDRGYSWAPSNAGLPTGPVVTSLAVSGSSIFAGIGNPGSMGPYRSEDGGLTWNRLAAGFPANDHPTCLAVSGTTVLAGTREHGIYRFASEWPKWEPAGVLRGGVAKLSAFGASAVALNSLGQVLVSKNGGRTWSRSQPGPLAHGIISISAGPDAIYVGTDGAGVWKRNY